ncbi:MAG: helix-turn-helix transcriptional regulator [Spirochaetaceae bacterium]|jgi:transcriptional regulator with XRE-family HTH domain|nr:helix-turn-helix transcriptional regulator [Spirochaetaceae bacterium]
MVFKDNLKSELSYKNVMVKELAAVTGISKKTLDNYLNVRGNMPSADVAVKIAQALGVTVEYLVTGEEITPARLSQGPEIKELIQDFKQLNGEDRQLIKDILQLLKAKEKKNTQ